MHEKGLVPQDMHLVTRLLVTSRYSEPFWVEILVRDADRVVPWTDIMKFISLCLMHNLLRNALDTKSTK